MRVLAFLLCAAAAFGAVEGTVNNRTTGKPQSGTMVMLFKLGQTTGPEMLASTKSDNQGRFSFAQDVAGAPHLIEAVHGSVTYTAMLPPGAPSGNVTLEVYDSSRRPGQARLEQRMMVVEPGGAQLAVSEVYFLRNPGNLTWHDAENGTLRFFVPAEARDSIRVMAVAPQGVPVERAALETGETGVYKLNFPIKPGETRVDVSYTLPFTTPGILPVRTLTKGVPARIVAPAGVTVSGEGLESLGSEPSTQAAIFETAAQNFKLNIEGSGTLRAMAEAEEDTGPSIQTILPRIYGRLAWVLIPSLVALGLGFVLLYRRGAERG